MGQNNPLPDFDNISGAFTTLGVEIPRLRNHQQLAQEIRQGQQQLQQQMQQMQQSQQRFQQQMQQSQQQLQQQMQQMQQSQQQFQQQIQQQFSTFSRRLVVIENTTIQIKNKQSCQANPAARLSPLLNPVTGDIIPDCPTTAAQIHKLTAAQATRLLEILQVPVPAGTVEVKKTALLQQFL
ncbi:hypothetical protein QBC46DRAFT_355934 [Diplogelasinospora grovesii]|uniref:Uncharacterized protein n=1 Tax=Diplogelasinospora grovesii TaxID=303347 RepID=A0AAN6S258_9PEZI|nr:hypothetical protein QBC46DRAFT_355934 [Diplogelasinospora grovesii]